MKYLTLIIHHNNCFNSFVMKNIILFLVFTFIASFSVAAQNEKVETLLKKGVALHDKGKYKEAIDVYEQALEIDNNNAQVLYEMGLTYFTMKDYNKAIKYSNLSIENSDEFALHSYINIGSSYDDMGQPKKAISTYNKALKKFDADYLLHFNLAITLFKLKEYDDAGQHLEKAIALNPGHGSSHYILGLIRYDQNQRVQSLLSLYFFLLLDQESERNGIAMDLLIGHLGAGVKQISEKETTISLDIDMLKGEFSAAETLLSLTAALRNSEEHKSDTEAEFLFFQSKRLFSSLKESADKQKGFYWDFYVQFYTELMDSEHGDTFLYYITAPKYDTSATWLKENEKKEEAMLEWIVAYKF